MFLSPKQKCKLAKLLSAHRRAGNPGVVQRINYQKEQKLIRRSDNITNYRTATVLLREREEESIKSESINSDVSRKESQRISR